VLAAVSGVLEAEAYVAEVEANAADAEPEVRQSRREPLRVSAGDALSAKPRPSIFPRVQDPLFHGILKGPLQTKEVTVASR
jgi:hypothetical protein